MGYKGKVLRIPDGVEILGQGAFMCNERIEVLILPKSVRIIRDDAFAFCISLKKVIIEGCLEEIGDNSFYGCTGLKMILNRETLRKSVIGKNALIHTLYEERHKSKLHRSNI